MLITISILNFTQVVTVRSVLRYIKTFLGGEVPSLIPFNANCVNVILTQPLVTLTPLYTRNLTTLVEVCVQIACTIQLGYTANLVWIRSI